MTDAAEPMEPLKVGDRGYVFLPDGTHLACRVVDAEDQDDSIRFSVDLGDTDEATS